MPSLATPAVIPQRLRSVWLAALVLLCGCANQEQYRTLPVATPELFSATGESPPPQRWWVAFGDPALDRLVARALVSNRDLQAAYQRLQQARALQDRASADLFPRLDGTAAGERRETTTETTDIFSAGFEVAYEVDIWGRIRAQEEAEKFRAAASLADYQAAALALAAQVSRTWFGLLEQRAQYLLGQSQLQTNRDILAVIEARFGRGLSSSADVLRQRQLVVASREELLLVTARLEIFDNQLAVLLGEAPNIGSLPPGDSLDLPAPLPDTGLPAKLIQRRPDVQSAYLELLASDADLAAAISARLPRLSITGSYGSSAEGAAQLFDDWLTSLAGNLVLPLVDGGQRRAQVRFSRALREQRLHEYAQAALVAIREVEDALVQEQQQHQRISNLEQQIQLAESAYGQLRLQYVNGAVSYLEVLNALRDKQDLRRRFITARRQLLDARADLYRALAGSFFTDPRAATQA